MKQKFINGITVISILLLLGTVVSVLVLDGLAQSIVQKRGGQGLGVKLTLDRIHIGFFDTHSSFHGLQISNPNEFATEEYPTLLSVSEATATFGLKSFLDKPIVIQNAIMSGVTLHLNQIDGQSNVETIVNNVLSDKRELITDSHSSFVIDTLTISDITVVAAGKFTAAGSGSVTTHIDKIVLNNLGTASDGEVAVEAITSAVTHAIAKHLAKHPVEGLSTIAISHVTDLIDTLPVFSELEVGTTIQEITDELGKGADDLLNAVGDLFE
ncbi:MAG: hypothetical protein VX436_02810 [Planctomycetota bacterium]|nr:hypothetical protein [Planctomycetota bacterium]